MAVKIGGKNIIASSLYPKEEILYGRNILLGL